MEKTEGGKKMADEKRGEGEGEKDVGKERRTETRRGNGQEDGREKKKR